MNYHQKKLAVIGALFLIVFIGVATLTQDKARAGALYALGTYKSPRIQQICYDSFVINKYFPKREAQCRSLWNAWAEEMRANAPY